MFTNVNQSVKKASVEALIFNISSLAIANGYIFV